jgi:hypothetical protein
MEVFMKNPKLTLIPAALLWLCCAGVSATDVNIGLSANDDGVKGFYFSIGSHYNVPEKEVVVIRERNVPDDELPVVFFLARHGGVAPSVIVKMRLDGKSWMDITLRYGLSPKLFYVNFSEDPGPPYGKAWGHFKNHKKDKWKEIRLTDDEIVTCVNTKFMCERYGYSPDELVKVSRKGNGWVSFNSSVKHHKEAKHKSGKHRAESNDDDNDHGKGHAKGKGKK